MESEALEFEAAEAPAKTATAQDLRALLRRKFPAEAYAMLYEVRDAAGHSANRSADVVMVGLWPSRGCQIEGMEIKISRSDWLRELKKPEKAEAFVPYCDRWWVVANPGVVKVEELPPTWGLLVPSGKGLGIVKQAPLLEAKPMDRSLLAAMLKRATATTLADPEVQAAIAARVKAEKEQFKSMESYDLRTAKDRAEALEKAIAEFQEHSGVEISSYRGARLGDAVKLVMAGQHNARINECRQLRDRVARLAEYMATEFPDPTPDLGGTEHA